MFRLNVSVKKLNFSRKIASRKKIANFKKVSKTFRDTSKKLKKKGLKIEEKQKNLKKRLLKSKKSTLKKLKIDEALNLNSKLLEGLMNHVLKNRRETAVKLFLKGKKLKLHIIYS